MSTDSIALSKRLSYYLRHNLHNIPETLHDGYVPVRVLLGKKEFQYITVDEVHHVVSNNNKNRFELTTRDGVLMIRARQGHSHSAGSVIDMTSVLEKITQPLSYCAHGTTKHAYEKIQTSGLSRMNRTHIHFASSPYAISGFRTSSQVLIHIDMFKAMQDGIEFYRSSNGVILSEGMNGIISPMYIKNVEIS